MLKFIFSLVDFNMTPAAATSTGAAIAGIILVAIGALCVVLFVKFMMWFWDQNL